MRRSLSSLLFILIMEILSCMLMRRLWKEVSLRK